MGKTVFNEDKHIADAIAASIQARLIFMSQNEIDDYKLIGLQIDQAIHKLYHLFPNSNNHFSYPLHIRPHDSSCLFQFGEPLQMLHIFVEDNTITKVIKIF